MSTQNKERIDFLYKTLIAIAISIGGFFANRIVEELDEARRDIRQLEITVSNIEGLLKINENIVKTNGK